MGEENTIMKKSDVDSLVASSLWDELLRVKVYYWPNKASYRSP